MKYRCPYCDEILTEEEAEQVVDEGCACCRRRFDVSDYVIEDEENTK